MRPSDQLSKEVMNRPNEVRGERERDRAGYFRKIAYALRDAFGLGIIGFDPDFLMVADEIRKSVDIPEFLAVKLLDKVNADAKRIAELEGCVAALRKDAERMDWIAAQCRSCSVDIGGQHSWSRGGPNMVGLRGPTFRDAIDAAMKRSASDTPMALEGGEMKVKIEVIEGCAGNSLSIGNGQTGFRLAGPKPLGGGSTLHSFDVDAHELIREVERLNGIPHESTQRGKEAAERALELMTIERDHIRENENKLSLMTGQLQAEIDEADRTRCLANDTIAELQQECDRLAARLDAAEKLLQEIRLDGCDPDETMEDLWDRTIERIDAYDSALSSSPSTSAVAEGEK